MKKLALVLVLGAFAAVPAAAKEPQQAPLLALVSDGHFATLERVDPVTLDQREGRVATLPADTAFIASSPDHTRVALGVGFPGRLRVFNSSTLVPARRSVALYGGAATGIWTRAGIVVLTWGDRGGFYVTANSQLRHVRYHRFVGNAVAFAHGAALIAMVLAPANGFGAARLGVIDAAGRFHSADLPGIAAGTAPSDADPGGFRIERPAVALAPDGSRAVVVSSTGTVAEVDLTTMQTTQHLLAARALAKTMEGAIRSAAWVGETLAVAGADVTPTKAMPAGLTLVNTAKWAARHVDATTLSVAAAGDGFVGYGSTASYEELGTGSETVADAQGDGLAAYSASGALRFRVFARTPIEDVQVVGAYAYARYLSSTFSSMWSVVDVASGRVLTTTDSRGGLQLMAP